MEERTTIYDAFFGTEYLSDTVTPVVVREEVVYDVGATTDCDFIELQPVKTNMPGPSGQNLTDSTSMVKDNEQEPSGHTSMDMDIETGSNEQNHQIEMDRLKQFIDNLSSDESPPASQQTNAGVIFHWGESDNPRVEINKKNYSITRVSKKGNLSLRCSSSHKKIRG